MEGEAVFKVVAEYGIMGVLLWFFVKQSQKQTAQLWKEYKEREKEMTTKINNVEEYVKTELSSMVREVSVVVSRNTEVMERLEEYLEHHDQSSKRT